MINIQRFGGRGSLSSKSATKGIRKSTSSVSKTQVITNKSIGKINGEEIRSFTLVGEQSGEAGEFKSLRELYKQIQELNRIDKKEYGETDTYTIDVNTDTTSYTGYKISKYRDKYRLK